MARQKGVSPTMLTPAQIAQIKKEIEAGAKVYRIADRWKISYRKAKAIADSIKE